MKTNLTQFAQIIQSLSRNCYKTLVKHYDTDKHNKRYRQLDTFNNHAFCQFSKLNSLRGVTNGYVLEFWAMLSEHIWEY